MRPSGCPTQTGVEIPDIDRLQKVIDGVLARKNLAAYLPLPEWARDVALLVGLKQIQNILHQEFVDILGEAPGAWHFDRLIGAFDDFVNNRTDHKLVLYSGHDTNMMTFGRLLNITGLEKELQPLASYLAFELHSDDEDSQDYRIQASSSS
ncbi:hypothetical protein M3Y99_00074400 [Aphelenchoides fujianensis]|nr:hypothetical protein M3Y99_00074400 [Aphelenchoides fujianensis]